MLSFKKGRAVSYLPISQQSVKSEQVQSRLQWKIVQKKLPWQLELLLNDASKACRKFKQKSAFFSKRLK